MNTLPGPAKLDFYGKLAFAAIVLAVFGEFLRVDRVTGTPGRLVLVFALGALHAVIGILCTDGLGRLGERLRLGIYFGVQCGLVVAILLLTPLKGFSFLIAMPITSMAVLDLRWPAASMVVGTLFAASVTAIALDFGVDSALRVIPSYGIAFVFTVLFSFVTRRALEARQRAEHLSTELTAANEQLRRFAAQADELATTRERNRIAREIHDGVGHYLTTINVQIEAARAVAATDPARSADALEKASRLSREALDDIRRSVGTLRTDAALPPLSDALRALGANLGAATTVLIRGQGRPLPPPVEHALYRSAQEALTNICKHAAARHAELVLDYQDKERVRLIVVDDGRGRSGGSESTGHGLRGLRERIELLGGTLSAGNRPEGGFMIDVAIPT